MNGDARRSFFEPQRHGPLMGIKKLRVSASPWLGHATYAGAVLCIHCPGRIFVIEVVIEGLSG